jgi:hypothetical protein
MYMTHHTFLPSAPLYSTRSVVFNFLGRDFFNALSEKNEDLFTMQLVSAQVADKSE